MIVLALRVARYGGGISMYKDLINALACLSERELQIQFAVRNQKTRNELQLLETEPYSLDYVRRK